MFERTAHWAESRTDSVFTVRGVAWYAWVTLSGLVLLNVAVRTADRVFFGDRVPIPRHWPISIFTLDVLGTPLWQYLVVAVAALLAFGVGAYAVIYREYSLDAVVAVGVATVLLTNLLQGGHGGFVKPLAGPDQYMVDVERIDSASALLADYSERQSELRSLHSRTHPPGALLALYALYAVTGSVPATAALIGVASVSLSAAFVFWTLEAPFGERTAAYATLLFVSLPAVQVYFVATIDPLIATAAAGMLYFTVRRTGAARILGVAVTAFLGTFATFTFVIPLAGVGLYALVDRDGLADVAAAGGLVVGAYLLLWRAVDFSYPLSFLAATRLEAGGGFLLTERPLTYVVTRAENVLELGLFFTPFLSLAALRGTRFYRDRRRLFAASGGAMLALLALFAVGLYRTGETARGALFVYPFAMPFVAAALDDAAPSRRGAAVLSAAVFAQAVLFQALGDFWW